MQYLAARSRLMDRPPSLATPQPNRHREIFWRLINLRRARPLSQKMTLHPEGTRATYRGSTYMKASCSGRKRHNRLSTAATTQISPVGYLIRS